MPAYKVTYRGRSGTVTAGSRHQALHEACVLFDVYEPAGDVSAVKIDLIVTAATLDEPVARPNHVDVVDADEQAAIVRAYIEDYTALCRKHGLVMHRVVEGEQVQVVAMPPDMLDEYCAAIINAMGGRLQ